ncbi:MAG TPA: BTAD domain-containing putative transcriptional regulator [Ktedonobacteraceae bacterium]
MPTLNIYLFGKFCVRRNDQIVEGLDARKVQELFCYLLLHRDHSLPRETLASVLWPDTTTALSKKSLRQTLWQLQSALGTQNEATSERILMVESEWIRLNPEADFWLDIAVVEHAFDLAQKVPGRELDTQMARVLQEAVQLYQGPLLEGWYADWCLYERERLQGIYLTLLDKLMGYCEAQRDYETGLLYGMRILCYDRTRERTHRRLMRLHYLHGDRAAALRQYEQCSMALEEELGANPSKGTVVLYEQILADQLDVPEPARVPIEISHEISEFLLPVILNRLLQLQAALSDLQNQLGQSIQVVEEALAGDALLVQRQFMS